MKNGQPKNPARLRAQTHAVRGRRYFALNRFGEALAAYEDAIREDATYLPGHTGKANALAMLGKHAEALAVCDDVAARAPETASAYVTKANVLHRMGRAAEALPLYRRGVEVQPAEFGAQYDFACYWALEGDTEKCREHLTRALALDPRARAKAAIDPDFDAVRETAWFQTLTALKR